MPREGKEETKETKKPHYEVKGAEPIDPKSKEKLKLEDSNLANYGSKEHKELKLKVAKSEVAWKGAGATVGTQIWRIEKFQVVAWPTDKYGSFFEGDSYIILNTYKAKNPEGKEVDKMLYNVHFWLGKLSTQDERGTAAYKTVELDDLLGDAPVQFREVQGRESKEFLAIFKAIKILAGGVDSGFNIVKPTEYKARLLHVHGVNAKFIRVDECPRLARDCLNNGDVFILDAGLNVFQFNGANSSVWEKRRGEELVNALVTERLGRPTKKIMGPSDDDEKFWGLIGGKGSIPEGEPRKEIKVGGPSSDKEGVQAEAPETEEDNWSPLCVKELYRVDVSPGASEATFTGIRAGGAKVEWSDFKSNGVFILDVEDEDKRHHVYVWVGCQTSKTACSLALQFGEEFAVKFSLRDDVSIVRVIEGGQRDIGFVKAVEDSPDKKKSDVDILKDLIDKSSTGTSSSSSSSSAPSKKSEPKPPRSLTVTVHSMKDLVNLDKVGKTDPYVKVALLDAKNFVIGEKKSKVVTDNLNPVYDFAADFKTEVNTTEGWTASAFEIQAWDHDVGKDELIGCYRVDIGSTAKSATLSTLPLTGGKKNRSGASDSGSVIVSYTFNP